MDDSDPDAPTHVEYGGAKNARDGFRVRHGTMLARRHCAAPKCGKVLKDRRWSGFCHPHWVEWRREYQRLWIRNKRDRARGRESRADILWIRKTRPKTPA